MRKTNQIFTVTSKEQGEIIKRGADINGESIASFVRRVALQEARKTIAAHDPIVPETVEITQPAPVTAPVVTE